jgi:hypothetical protein
MNTLEILDFDLSTIAEDLREKFRAAGHTKSGTIAEMAAEKVRYLDESAGFSAADITPLQKRPHMDHAKDMLEAGPTFNVLASNHIAKSCLKAVATVTRIPYGILKEWRRHLLTDREWRLYQHRNARRRSRKNRKPRSSKRSTGNT